MSDVINGNLYPTDGSVFAVPQDQVDERLDEQNSVMATLPLLEQMLKRYDERIALYKSVDAIPDEVKVKPDEFMHVVAANALTAQNLEQERTYIQNLIAEYR